MKPADIQRRRSEILHLIDDNRILDALHSIRTISEAIMAYELSDEIDSITQAYRYLLQYALNGTPDPSRAAMRNSIIDRAIRVLDKLEIKALTPETPTLYYNVKRLRQMRPDTDLAALVSDYRQRLGKSSLFELAGNQGDELKAAHELEECEKQIFNAVWTTFPLSDSDRALIAELIDDPSVGAHMRRLLIAALSLGLDTYYDENRLLALIDIYDNASDDACAMAALAGILLALHRHQSRTARSTTLRQRLDALRESSPWSKDVPMMYMEFIRTRDVETIDKTFREDIIPKINKIKPDIKQSFDKLSVDKFDPESDQNPEWADLLEKSGISERLRQLSEMQEQGSDVMMSAFAHMKSFPFFNDISNWFMPFHKGHSIYLGLDDGIRRSCDMFIDAMGLCDGDKFSLTLSLGHIGDKNRDILTANLDAMGASYDEFIEQARQMENGTDARRRAANLYVRDLYRFYKLFRRKGEFSDPFDGHLNLFNVSLLRDDLGDTDTMQVVAEFYFSHKQWDDALAVMTRLVEERQISASLFQKMGYCRQQSGDDAGALEYYRQAELFDADSVWLIKRLARCCRVTGDLDAATEYYRRLDTLRPDDFGTTMALGTIALEKKQYAEALGYLHKAEFINEKSSKPLRPIAWAALMTGDFDKASKYYAKICENAPGSDDIVNMGHVCLLKGDIAGAVERYRTAAALNTPGRTGIISQLRQDSASLATLGVSQDILDILPDLLADQ